ncbi:sulfurtransferase [Rhizobium sp. P40RR-XXII]|uniref:chromate resistance protein ChrB domain-containing protein n=1 Tax=unclassified Rhizobium TaxID=2613769 RepID=UPI001456E0C7|nr:MULTISPECIES: sulfurtransferase/chromate resistance protein [unclassified Rhizobium]NLR87362.1 sulfurtransferase [Rhizobium sp. P28RR-XV]NLS19149.1 sulfurtransferase [Rhizobium sp. P40RR-XXII]
MPSFLEISSEKLNRIIGTPNAPAIIDVRTDDDFASDPRLVPGSIRRNYKDLGNWAGDIGGPAVIVCQGGLKLSHGVAAYLRQEGTPAEVLEGGFEAWIRSGGAAVPNEKLPQRNLQGRTVWVTRSRPKIDRIACPWLIRRFVDPSAVFLFVPTSEVSMVGDRFGATPFDIEQVFWSHRGEFCTFDVMIEEFGLTSEPLSRLATIVRGADTARPDLAPEVPGLLAASLGLSRMFNDDLEQLDAGMLLYDAFYRWCRDATDETHNWPSQKRA